MSSDGFIDAEAFSVDGQGIFGIVQSESNIPCEAVPSSSLPCSDRESTESGKDIDDREACDGLLGRQRSRF
jgi:hypothetical protein